MTPRQFSSDVPASLLARLLNARPSSWAEVWARASWRACRRGRLEAVECARGAAWRRAPPPYLLASAAAAAAAAAAAVPLVGLTTPAGGSRGRMSLSVEAGLTW